MKADWRSRILTPQNPAIYTIVFIVTLLTLFYFGYTAFRQLNRMEQSEQQLLQSVEVRLKLEHLFSSLKDVESAQRGYIITRDSLFLDLYNNKDSTIFQILNELDVLVSTNKEQSLLSSQIQEASYNRLQLLEETKHLATLENPNVTLINTRMQEGRTAMEEIRSLIKTMIRQEELLLQQRTSLFRNFFQHASISYLLIVLFAFSMFVFSFYKILGFLGILKSADENILFQNSINDIAEKNAHFGTYAIDVHQKPFYYSDNLVRILGHVPGKENAIPNLLTSRIAHEDESRIREARDKMWHNPSDQSWEYKIQIPGQPVKYLREAAELRKIGQLDVLVGSIQDITHDKLSAQNLENAFHEIGMRDTISAHAEESVKIGNGIWNQKTGAITCSENLLRLLGLEKNQKVISPKVLLEFLDKESQYEAIEYIDQVMATGKVEPKIFKVNLPHQAEKYFRLTGKFFTIGNQRFLIGTFQDISADILLNEKLLTSHAALHKSEIRHLQMVSEIEDYAIILLNKDGIIENWNKGAEKIKGYEEEEILGKHISIFYTEEDRFRNIPQQLLETAKLKGRVIHEGWRLRKDKSRFWGFVVITAIHGQDGQVIGYTKITRDLTNLKQLEEEQVLSRKKIEVKNLELERINKELSSFNHIASHDLQEPLRKIQTFLSRIHHDKGTHLSTQSAEFFDRIQKSSHRMQVLIQDLIAYSHARIDIPFVKVELQAILKAVSVELSGRLEEAGGTMHIGKLPTIEGYPIQLEQLFTNIIGNSIKYRYKDRPLVIDVQHNVTVGVPGESEHTDASMKFDHISISDNGIGFENQYAERIFRLFYRLHGKVEYSGSGIGLAICQRIMENHHGFIRATGEAGVGATFHLYFPKA